MEQGNNVIIIERVLLDNKVKSLADLADKPKLFCKVFKAIFGIMKDLMKVSEDKIPTPTLEVIRDDLVKLSNVLDQYSNIADEELEYPDNRIDYKYPLDELMRIIDDARTPIITAIGETKKTSSKRTKGIQSCKYKIAKAIEMMKEFEARRI